MFQPRSATFQQEVGEDIRGVLEAALLQARQECCCLALLPTCRCTVESREAQQMETAVCACPACGPGVAPLALQSRQLTASCLLQRGLQFRCEHACPHMLI